MAPAKSVRPVLNGFGLVALFASLLAFAPPAQAEVPSHPFRFTLIASPGLEPPERRYPPPREGFEDPCGVAVDSAGDIYVADYYHDAVDVFNPSNEYLTQIAAVEPLDGPCGLAVDSAGEVYVNNWRRNVVKFTPSEYPPTASTRFGPGTVIDFPSSTGARSTGVALDSSGNVFIDDRTYVAEYGPSGTLLAEFGLGSLGSGYGIAVSSFPATAGDVYVPDAATGTVKAFGPGGASIGVIDGAGTPQAGFSSLVDSSVAVDPTDGHVFVADNLLKPFAHPAVLVDEFNASGIYRGQISNAQQRPIFDSEPSGLALDGSGNVYVTSGNTEEGLLYGFGPTEAAQTLTVSKSGSGAGTVSSAPAGIDCGSACAAEYNQGEALTLTATPAPGSAFLGWTGSACTGTGPCHLTLSADTEISAEFEALPPSPLLPAGPTGAAGAGPGALSASAVAPSAAAAAKALSPQSIHSHPHSRHPHKRHRHKERGPQAKSRGR
jgi:streptogramin lyase